MKLIVTALGIVVTLAMACVWAPYEILRESGASLAVHFGALQMTAVLLGLVGIVMIVWVSTAFVRLGKGTPIPVVPPKYLVNRGLYRAVRNPMYLGFLLVLLAESMYFISPWLLAYATAVGIALHLYLLLLEEPRLERRFGSDYTRYKQEVPRWIPRLRPAQSD